MRFQQAQMLAQPVFFVAVVTLLTDLCELLWRNGEEARKGGNKCDGTQKIMGKRTA
jgi:hypothetical protein